MATPAWTTRPLLGAALMALLIALTPSHRPADPERKSAAPDLRVSEREDRSAQEGRSPSRPTGLAGAPPEVRALLDQVFERVPEAGAGVRSYRFHHWGLAGHPTRAALGIKAIAGVDPDELIAQVMDVDGYEGQIAHIKECRSRPDPSYSPPESVRFVQRIDIPAVTEVQHELVLVDAGTIKGYRVAYWSLLPEEAAALDLSQGARSEFNVGVWLAAPGVVGYAFNSWPRRQDVNTMQWFSMTTGATVLARRVVETNIDAMASWALRAAQETIPSDEQGPSAGEVSSSSAEERPRGGAPSLTKLP